MRLAGPGTTVKKPPHTEVLDSAIGPIFQGDTKNSFAMPDKEVDWMVAMN